jgi:uncharacterized membrane protein YgaE (UPF0421/DUF939 family)
MGTILGGITSGFIHTISDGWWGLIIAMLILIPSLRLLNWQGGLGTAVVFSSMLFLVEDYSQLGWQYVFSRTIDTIIGVFAVVIVSILFWRIDRTDNLLIQEQQLKTILLNRVEQTKIWLTAKNSKELNLASLKCSKLCLKFREMASEEVRNHPNNYQRRWLQRARLWDQLNLHSMQLIQLAAQLPQACLAESDWLNITSNNRLPLRQLGFNLAENKGVAPLLILALQDEYRLVFYAIKSLRLAAKADQTWAA